MKTYWVSLAPERGASRVVLVDAESKLAAGLKVHHLGLVLPGDESFIVAIPPGEKEHKLPRDRVVTVDELRAVGAQTIAEMEAEMECIAQAALKEPGS